MTFHDELNEIRRRAGLPLMEQEWHGPLYHGTSSIEFEKLKASGYNAQGLYLGDSFENIAMNYAEQQAERDGSNPVFLMIDGSKLENVEQDYHDEDRQEGQFIYTGPLRHALVRAEMVDADTGEEVELPL